jgi:hypothetical protein
MIPQFLLSDFLISKFWTPLRWVNCRVQAEAWKETAFRRSQD